MKFVPLATSGLSGENSRRESLANEQGRKFANVSISFRIPRRPKQISSPQSLGRRYPVQDERGLSPILVLLLHREELRPQPCHKQVYPPEVDFPSHQLRNLPSVYVDNQFPNPYF